MKEGRKIKIVSLKNLFCVNLPNGIPWKAMVDIDNNHPNGKEYYGVRIVFPHAPNKSSLALLGVAINKPPHPTEATKEVASKLLRPVGGESDENKYAIDKKIAMNYQLAIIKAIVETAEDGIVDLDKIV